MVNVTSSIMCRPTTSDGSFCWGKEKRGRALGSGHYCVFKILKCTPQQLCILCFLLYNLAVGTLAEEKIASTNSTSPIKSTESLRKTIAPLDVQCTGETCYLKLSSKEQALKKMVTVTEHLYNSYTNDSQKKMYAEQLEKFIKDVGLLPENGHHHGPSIFEDEEFLDLLYNYDYNDYEEETTESRKRRSADEFSCISSTSNLMREYFSVSASENYSLTLDDFMTLMPQILLDIKRPMCTDNAHDHGHNHGHGEDKVNIEHSTRNIWLISFASVLIISLVSLVGVMVIPLLRHSKILNNIISFLVSLAVGTLAGDALLHLLPHASGLHDHDHGSHGHGDHGHGDHGHGDHGHGDHGDEDHFDSMWKGLVACCGIYVFYILETVMSFFHNRKMKKEHGHICAEDSPTSSSPSKQGLKEQGGADMSSPSESPLLTIMTATSHGAENGNGGKQLAIEMDEEILGTGHHHSHTHEVPKTIARLAWMVIIGDGLHNVTDGLAIGAAFTSSIGAGLSTVLAIFFHEIPQELGDFAILLNSGMTVKQALLWNFISACMCFIGLIIGLLVGEYTKGIILWILAFTAGGFLYIALTDMLPAMIKQLNHKDYLKRYIMQNIGMICGFGIMVVIGLNEEAFAQYF